MDQRQRQHRRRSDRRGVTILLAVAVAVLALIKKRRLIALLLLVLTLCCVYFGTWASRLFVLWDDLFYYAVIDTLLLSIVGFGFLAAYAVNDFQRHKGKRAVIVTLIVLAVAAAPYEVGILLINTIIYGSQRPTFSIAMSALIPMAVILADLVIITVKLLRGKKDRPDAPANGAESPTQTDTP